jgi:hypothetical protein
MTTILGLRIVFDQVTCECGNVCSIHKGKGPHVGELRYIECDRHRGWLPKEVACFLESVIAIFGIPDAPIVVRKVHKDIEASESATVSAEERQRRIYEVRRRVETGGFEVKDFLLTAPRQRDYWREQHRREIAHLMHRYGISAYSLVDEEVE